MPSALNPQSICLTEFHFVLLYKDRVVGVCNLNDVLVYEEALPLVCGHFGSSCYYVNVLE